MLSSGDEGVEVALQYLVRHNVMTPNRLVAFMHPGLFLWRHCGG